MKVPLLDLNAQMASIRSQIEGQIEDVLDSCMFINGPKVVELEAAVASYVGAGHGIGVSSGTDALLVGLMGLGVGPGDVVLTTPYSFFATAGAVSRLGAEPAFVDIDPQSYNLDPGKLEAWFADNPQRRDSVKAIIPVHLYGQSCDMDPIMATAARYGVPVIEDAAQAIGTGYDGAAGPRRVGSIGDIGCFSFFPSKNLGGAGDGGMVVVQDDELAARIRKLKNHGAYPKYYHELIGGNFRLDALQAAVLLAKLPLLEGWHEARRQNAQRYDTMLSDTEHVTKPTFPMGIDNHIFNQYVIRADRRDELRSYLGDAGIGSEVYYPVPFHEQKCFEYLGYRLGDFPNAEAAARETLAIPIYPELTEDMQAYVVEKIGAFYA